MDLPAPVSPVSTLRPGANSSAACSIRTMSRMVSAVSTSGPAPEAFSRKMRPTLESENAVESLTDPGAFVFHGLEIAALQDVVGILVPGRAGIIGAQHGGGGLRLIV